MKPDHRQSLIIHTADLENSNRKLYNDLVIVSAWFETGILSQVVTAQIEMLP